MFHTKYMQEALKEAEKAYKRDEVPVGAVLVHNNKIIVRACNASISLTDPTAHAEMLVLKKSAKFLNNYRLNNLFLYVTLEPCIMCLGAMVLARVSTLVYGAKNKKAGACGTVFDIKTDKLNHKIDIVSDVLEQESKELLKNFFKNKRRK